MTSPPHPRTRRPLPGLFPSYDIRASKHEVSKDLQQFYQGSAQLLPPTEEVARSKEGSRPRKRTFSTRESELMDAVLGLASLVCEGEMPLGNTQQKRRFVGEIKPKPAPTAAPRLKPAPKPRPLPPAVPKKAKPSQPPKQTASQPLYQSPYQLPYGYPYPLGNYIYPYLDKSQPILSILPSLGLPGQGLFPPFGMMFQPGMLGAGVWPVSVAQPAPVLPATQSRVYKRSARHVAIAFLIKAEEGKKKGREEAPVKFARYV